MSAMGRNQHPAEAPWGVRDVISRLDGEIRHDVATRLLRKTDATVLETVLETGYEVPFHCDRGFRHVAGISPREYRLHYQQHQVYIFPAGGIEKKPG